MRVKRGTKRRHRRTRLLARAKGFYLAKHNLYNIARQAVEKALGYAYVGRRQKKRDYRALWIVRIGAGARANGLSYSKLMNGLKHANVALDRKALADLALVDPPAFTRVVRLAREAGDARAQQVAAGRQAVTAQAAAG